MATSAMQLPTSNVAGNNQTSPGLSVQPSVGQAFTPTLPTGTPTSANPYLSATPTSPIGMGIAGPSAGLMPSGTLAPGMAGGTIGGLYNPASSQTSGQTDISKQLTDIYGKGVGGSLNYLLQGMSGTDSAIFQQYLASMAPQMAQAQARLTQGLGSMGVSGNSSVQGLAQADLQSQFLAQESGVNANLMQQQMQNTIGILTGAAPSAQKEVATSGWTDFANVMANITSDIGAMQGGSNAGAVSQLPGNAPGSFAAPQLGGGNIGNAAAGAYNYNPFQSSASSMYTAPDLSSFQATAPTLANSLPYGGMVV